MVNSFSVNDPRPGVRHLANFLSLQLLPWEDPTNWINAINKAGEKDRFKGWEDDEAISRKLLKYLMYGC